MINNEIEKRKKDGIPDVKEFYIKNENEIAYIKELIAEKYELISESLKTSSNPTNFRSNTIDYGNLNGGKGRQDNLMTHYISEINQVLQPDSNIKNNEKVNKQYNTSALKYKSIQNRYGYDKNSNRNNLNEMDKPTIDTDSLYSLSKFDDDSKVVTTYNEPENNYINEYNNDYNNDYNKINDKLNQIDKRFNSKLFGVNQTNTKNINQNNNQRKDQRNNHNNNQINDQNNNQNINKINKGGNYEDSMTENIKNKLNSMKSKLSTQNSNFQISQTQITKKEKSNNEYENMPVQRHRGRNENKSEFTITKNDSFILMDTNRDTTPEQINKRSTTLPASTPTIT